MAGIVGYIDNQLVDKKSNLLTMMSQAIRYTESDKIDKWQDDYFSVCRVHHGIVNREEQPVFNEDRSLLIFMDGEIFDYETNKKILLDKGHHFQYDHNDAEFCLHFYEEKGIDSFTKLNGSFLITIYNIHSKTLLIVNDRFSSLPLYYYESNGAFIFGAQLKAILQSDKIPRNLDLESVVEFFSFHRVMGTSTYYKDIKVMLPATILSYERGKINFKTYWEMNYREDGTKSKKYYAYALTDTLKNAVRRRSEGKHRYGILLSGGLDSRAVLAACKCKVTAFTLGDWENYEVKTAKKIAKIKGCEHIFLKRNPDYYADIVDKSVDVADGMYCFHHAHFTDFLGYIKEKTDILLHGCYIDTLFKGLYLPSKKVNILGKTISLPILSNRLDMNLSKAILQEEKHRLCWNDWLNQIFTKKYLKDLNKILLTSMESITNKANSHAKNNYNRYEYFFMHFLIKVWSSLNILSLRHYIDERTVPFDNDLFDLYLEMPPELRFNGRIYRKALKKIDLKLSKIPNASTGVKATIPDYVEFLIMMYKQIINKIYKPQLPNPFYTKGSWPNMAELIRNNGKLKQLIWYIINDEKSIDPAIFDRNRLVTLFKMHLGYKGDYTFLLLLIVTFGRWYSKYGPKF